MQRKYIDFSEGESRIYGYDYGKYPIHNFRAYNVMDKIYPVYAESAGNDLWHKQCCRQRINSDVLAIEYVIEGVFVFTHDDVEEECSSGDIFLLHHGSNSGMRCKTVTAAKKVIIMHGESLADLLRSTGLDRVFRIKVTDRKKVDELFDSIYAFDDTEPSGRISVLCYELLLTLAEQAVIAPRPAELQKALDFIRRSLDYSLSLDRLSHYAGVSNATLIRLFQKHFLSKQPLRLRIHSHLYGKHGHAHNQPQELFHPADKTQFRLLLSKVEDVLQYPSG